MSVYSWEDYKDNPFLSTETIGTLLYNGALTLFLGAGVSCGFSLPSWKQLVTNILLNDNDSAFVCGIESNNDKELTKLLNEIDDGTQNYKNKVYDALYKDIYKDVKDRLTHSPLLLAVAALITGSCRGRIDTIITYNYDDLLKQYLEMLGYRVCVRKKPSDISTRADVEISHVHGYLPQSRVNESAASELILSEKSFQEKRAFIDRGWSPYIEHCLSRKQGLFLGLSGNDSSIMDGLRRAHDNIDRKNDITEYWLNQDYGGYWLMTEEAYERNHKDIVNVGMCPVKLEEGDFPKYIFEVCQNAARES